MFNLGSGDQLIMTCAAMLISHVQLLHVFERCNVCVYCGRRHLMTQKKKKIIHNNLKFYIYLPLKKKKQFVNTLKFFYSNKIKF